MYKPFTDSEIWELIRELWGDPPRPLLRRLTIRQMCELDQLSFDYVSNVMSIVKREPPPNHARTMAKNQ